MRYLLCCVALFGWISVPAATADKDIKLSATEQKVVEHLNQARTKAKLPPVKPNALLCACARKHAVLMLKKGVARPSFDGKLPADQVKAAGYDAGYCASLAAQGGIDLGQVFMQLLGEKTCRQEILRRDVTEVGIGVASDGKGKVYYSIVLAKPK